MLEEQPMLTRIPVLALSLLALVTLACGCNIDLPNFSSGTVQTGPTQVDSIQIPAPDATPAALTFNFGAGEFNLSPGAASGLVDGTATYNIAELKPDITQSGASVTMSSGDINNKRLPLTLGQNVKNTWDLKLGTQPLDLAINAGAYHAVIDLGGLSIHSLDVSDGASQVDIRFSRPNLVTMEKLTYSTGASSVSLSDLANANVRTLAFFGGAGDYTLDFSGNLQADSDVSIEAGVCHVTLIIPEGTPVTFDLNGGIANVDMQGSFQGGGTQFNQPSGGPSLTIHVNISAGQLTIRNP
jgi:N-terminal domain of toast_rack, DUF2154